ncbi:MAG: U32 family peptidase [Phycisphaerae bacterium]|nr:U32 family peptidase [Phycisphaerae bacterium]
MAGPAANARSPELLAPAGDETALRAAVANGADAVYFGADDFNARRRAANVPLARLPATIDFLHSRNVRAYITLNTLVFSSELGRAARYVEAVAEAGADAVIVQDLGIAQLVRRMTPTLPVHASTQMTQSHAAGLTLLAELGVQRVILARELSIRQIESIARETTLELEVFVHGALCISYSGQCLASETLFGRSANRGVCAQACRLPYQLVIDGEPVDAPDAEYLLSPRDLAAWDRVRELTALGVRAFKIEGRLKAAPYVAAATGLYRNAIDAAVAGRHFSPGAQQESDLAQCFSRGFCHGYLDGPHHDALVHGRFPKSRGVRLGSVVGRTRTGLRVALEEKTHGPDIAAVKPGDGLVFDQGRPDEPEAGGRVYAVRTVPAATSGGGVVVELEFGRDDVDVASVGLGAQVWKTDDPATRRRLEQTYARDVIVRRRPLTARAFPDAEGRLCVEFADQDGHVSRVTTDRAPEPASRHPLTRDLIAAQLGRLGDTPFTLADVTLEGPEGRTDVLPVMVPKSTLNELRRRAVGQLLEARRAAARHAVADPAALESLRSQIAGRRSAAGGPRLHVLVRDAGQFAAVTETVVRTGVSVATVYIDIPGGISADDLRAARQAGLAIGVATPRVLMPGEEAVVAALLDAAPDAVLVRNLACLARFREHADRISLVADASLNAANELGASALLSWGVTRWTPAFDVPPADLPAALEFLPAQTVEPVLCQHVPLFHTAHCVAAARLSHASDCTACSRPCMQHEIHLRDRKNVDHPVRIDAHGRSTVFSAFAHTCVGMYSELRSAGVRDYRIELLDEPPETVAALLEAVTTLLSGSADPETTLQRLARLYPHGIRNKAPVPDTDNP